MINKNSLTLLKWGYLLPLLLFVGVALFYFHPVLQGKQIYQSDIVQYSGMAKERNDFREATGKESYWTNNAFGGMPTFQLGAHYPYDFIKYLDLAIRFLPRPADYLFLYFLGMYLLLLTFKVDYRLSTLGAIAFGLSTYLIIIIGVGHNAKAHAIGYIPFVLSGVVLMFRQRKLLLGFILSALAFALEVHANHFQMTYYLLILLLIFFIVQFLIHYKDKQLKRFLIRTTIFSFALMLGVGMNASNVLATKQYSEWSTRGKSHLSITPERTIRDKKNGLEYDYITEYSYGFLESFNLFIPRIMGGSGSEDVGESSHVYNHLINKGASPSQAKDFSANLPTYWGNQPIVVAPAYIGAVLFFLFVLALLLVEGTTKKWLLTGVLVSLILSFGKNVEFLTKLMIDYFPMYNKFRAITSIQIILECCIPILAVLGLKDMLSKDIPKGEKVNALKKSAIISLGIIVLLFIVQGMFSFLGGNDRVYLDYFGIELLEAIKEDRQSMYNQDLLRTLLFVASAILLLWLFLKDKISSKRVILLSGILIIIDLFGVDKKYVNESDFLYPSRLKNNFKMSLADKEILKDSTIFRVLDLGAGLTGGKTSYFHKTLSGYHAAKPMRMQDIFDFYFKEIPNQEILNMFNIKYLISDKDELILNDKHNGNAWFIDSLKVVKNADEDIFAIGDIVSKNIATIEQKEILPNTKTSYQKDSLSKITLEKYSPNKLIYQTDNPCDGFTVFSEMHYPQGWTATIDNAPAPHVFRVDYTLRGLFIPKGKHQIIFEFNPQVVHNGGRLVLASYISFVLITIVLIKVPKLQV